jgi:3-oxoadipate enol-lactonase
MADGALVLVHGYPLDGRMWRRQVEDLSDIRSVMAPDLDGHGAARGRPPATNMDAIAQQLARELDAAGIDAVDLGGLSMGGYVCFAFFRLFPERVRSLILVDTRAGADSDAGRQGRDEMATKVRQDGASVAAEAMLPTMFTPEVAPEVRAEAERIMIDQPPESLAADLMAMRDRPDSTPTLAQISVPTLIVVGANDEVTPPSESDAMAGAISGASLVVVPQAAHLSPMQQPDAVSRAIREHLGA